MDRSPHAQCSEPTRWGEITDFHRGGGARAQSSTRAGPGLPSALLLGWPTSIAMSGDTVGTMTRELITTAADGVARCGWVSDDPEYRRYHDEEWGVPLHGDQALFETIALEGFQAGLSWITILRRRSAFRSAFDDFSIARVAQYDELKADELSGDPTIIRNRQKILATIANAKIVDNLISDDPGALDGLVWGHAPASHARPQTIDQVLSVTVESTALSASLRRLGLKFVGPTTMHALMQAAGLINDHAVGCARGDELAAGRR